MLTTTIGACPKPGDLPLPDRFRDAEGPDTSVLPGRGAR